MQATEASAASRGLTVATSVLARTPLIDGHNDLPSALRIFHGGNLDGVGIGLAERQTDLPRMRHGLVGAQFWSIWVPTALSGPAATVAALEQIDLARRMIIAYSDDFELAVTADDIERIFASGRIASLLGVEGGHCIAESLGVLRSFAQLGVRYLTLTHGQNTTWADSATDEPGVGGLSSFGLAVVAELNRLGVLVDLSHVAESTQRDALDASRSPVIFSHSGAAGVTPHPRNVSDEILQRVAATGSVVQVSFVPDFINAAVGRWQDAARAERERLELTGSELGFWNGEKTTADERPGAAEYQRWADEHPAPVATLADAIAHIEHVRDVAGVDHVGIGSDFDGMFVTTDGLSDVSCYPQLFAALAERSWSPDELAALAGRNVLRVLREAESVARAWPAVSRPAADGSL